MQPHLPIGTGSVSYLNLESTVDAYAREMGILTTVLPLIKSPWLEVRYEDVVDNLESVSRRALDFLGISWDASCTAF